ncbi:glycoside hydrolase family 2 TIM barrel-domain containing protein [Fulvivirgaceae bacterium BMA12]|uniref:Glycoside hydrolase family 2 TIM barrel-domain containing protein n=1 Tax=Agaribacillus aureus TaxID=3051825 RepID=A0ABT8L5C7_9BACT|nr:glycoside hydrolase family 2 TIM barrel-domain containing protein [Fulvivirgaceae bacterium BMA12]
MKCHLIFILFMLPIFFHTPPELKAQGRQEIPFNDHWIFQGQSVSGLLVNETVSLPHSWNKSDAQEGMQYYRGIGKYQKSFDGQESWSNRRVFIRFEGVNITATLTLNGHKLGTHEGGYAAFCFEITDHLLLGQKNTIEVVVSNETNLEVIPLVGDFNNYGGIYRPVTVIVTDPVCITPLDFASPGVYIRQQHVSKESADVEVLTKISNKTGADAEVEYKSTIIDASGEVVESQQSKSLIPVGDVALTHEFKIKNPHLWNGKKDPYLYQVRIEILKDGVVIDSKSEPLGLRFFHIDANEGFFLNGEPVDLRGVSRHQDRKDKGSAISDADHREDMDLMLEMGINALRLAHYQHAEIVYDMTDENGVVVWAELPWVGIPGGFMPGSNGYENTEAFHTNAKQQLYELIRQNFNHPSILMWSIFNEIQNPESAKPIQFVEELNAIVKKEDPDRISVGASMLSPQEHPDLHGITDAIAWNRYFGWYYKEPKDMGLFLDQLHEDFPDYKIGISEYGAGGSVYQHSDELESPNPMGSPHPEEWQSYYHEENLKIFDDRAFVWGTFVWNMFDFGSHFRKEGDHYGINDKGMVTYDRKIKKDAFYFYKANWSDEPVLHITSSRYIFREKAETQVKVYTNLSDVSLTVNGEELPNKSPEKGIIIWEGIKLKSGNNGIIVRGTKSGRTFTDDCVFVLENPYEGINLFIKIFDFMTIAHQVVIGGLIAAFLVWLFGIRKVRRGPKWKKITLWIVFILLVAVSLLILGAKFFISNMMGG